MAFHREKRKTIAGRCNDVIGQLKGDLDTSDPTKDGYLSFKTYL